MQLQVRRRIRLQKFSFDFIQTLHYGCSHIEDVHFLFVHISWIFSHFWGVLNIGIFPTKNA